MKKILVLFLTGALFSAVVLGQDGKYQDKKFVLEQGVYRKDGLEIKADLEKNMIKMRIDNKTSELISVVWKESAYMGLNGKESRIYDHTQIKSGPYDKLINTAIRPGDSRDAELVPFENFEFEAPIAGYDNFNYRFKYEILDKKSQEYMEKNRDFAEIILLVEKGIKKQKTKHEIVIRLEEKDGKTVISGIENRSFGNVKNNSPALQEKNSDLEQIKKSLENELAQKERELKLLAEIEALQKQIEEKNKLLNEKNRKDR